MINNWLQKSKYFSYLTPKEGDEVKERESDFIWMTEDRILCSVPKEIVRELSIEEGKEQLIQFQEEYGIEKFRMIGVINPNAKSSKENRDWAAEIIPTVVEKIALISDSPLGRMAVKLFIGLRPPPYPLKVFKTSEEAFNWMREEDPKS